MDCNTTLGDPNSPVKLVSKEMAQCARSLMNAPQSAFTLQMLTALTPLAHMSVSAKQDTLAMESTVLALMNVITWISTVHTVRM